MHEVCIPHSKCEAGIRDGHQNNIKRAVQNTEERNLGTKGEKSQTKPD